MENLVQALARLRAVQEEKGWLPSDDLESIAQELRIPLHRLESVSTFYTHFRRVPPQGAELEVCRDLSCRLAGGAQARERLEGWAADRGDVEVRAVSCLGRCDSAPAVALKDRILDGMDLDAVEEAVTAADGSPVTRAPRSWPAADPYAEADHADTVSPAGDASARLGSYGVLRSVLDGSRADAIERLDAAGLRGMGGAGFPTARKWSLVAAAEGDVKHVICNADESEPGTFKDRELLHDLPHLVIEGMAIAGRCVGASRGTVFIRHEYGPERVRVEEAIAAAYDAGALGDDIFGSGFSFEIDVFVSPGGYILGEETALLECMEGRRGEPRNKPPFPGQSGLFGRPTLINNVETLVHAVSIIWRGVDWWRSLGREGFAGHKFLSVSGDVARPGVSLFATGTPLSEVLSAHGGMRDDSEPLAIAPGGASSHFLGAEALELALDFDALAEAGTMLGSGAAVFVGADRDLLEVGLSITRFFRNESCGKCVPCRVGSEKAVALIEKQHAISGEDEALLRELHDTMAQTSICGLGQVALSPLLSIVSRFSDRIPRSPGG